jgi:TIMELESS-interacting protein
MTSIDLYEDFNEDEDQRMGDDEEQEGDEENPVGSPVKAKIEVEKVKTKRKLITLNAERLKGPRGIVAIDEFFNNTKLKGRGHESSDLRLIMKNLEHWAFR